MANKIEWCDRTWSPVTGCSPISEGCANCWAKQFSKRLAGRYDYPADDPFKVTFHPDRLFEPTEWRGHAYIFVTSMGDLFHEDVRTEWLHQIGEVIREYKQHTFMLLTKRPERMRLHITSALPNVWLGVSTENQRRADERIPMLLSIPAAKHFLSVEPMLGPVHLFLERNHVDWVICGPETGPKARPCDKAWVKNLYEQCKEAGVPFWDKTDILGKNIKERP